MKPEFFGSAIVFSLAAAVIAVRDRRLQILILILAAAPAGVSEADLHCLLVRARACLVADDIDDQCAKDRRHTSDDCLSLLSGIPAPTSRQANTTIYIWIPIKNADLVHTIGATGLFISIAFCGDIRKHLDGAMGRTLGRFSFPIYLVHVPVIMSLGMVVFVPLFPLIGWTQAMSVSILASLAGIVLPQRRSSSISKHDGSS